MTDEQKEVIKGFVEENWTFFQQYLVRHGYGVMECEDAAIEMLDELDAI